MKNKKIVVTGDTRIFKIFSRKKPRILETLRSRILDKNQVQDSEQGFIYKEQPGPGFLTELRGLLGPEFRTELTLPVEGRFTGEKASEQVQDFGQSCNGGWVQHFGQGCSGLGSNSWSIPMKQCNQCCAGSVGGNN